MATHQYTKNNFPGEFVITGVLLARQQEKREWIDKQTNQPKSMLIDCLVLQGDYGICFVRCFNPKFDLNQFKQGEILFLPIERFEKENGIKACSCRL